jgi:hypothetical protein
VPLSWILWQECNNSLGLREWQGTSTNWFKMPFIGFSLCDRLTRQLILDFLRIDFSFRAEKLVSICLFSEAARLW